MKQQAVCISTQKNGIVPLMHQQFANPDRLRVLEGFDEQLIHLLPAIVRDAEIGRIKKDRIALAELSEGKDFERSGRPSRELFDVLVFHEHILPLVEFVALNNFAALYESVACWAKQRLSHPGIAFLMNLMKISPLAPGGRVQLAQL